MSEAHDPEETRTNISGRTLADYDERAADFWRGTRDHDVRQNIDTLLGCIEGVIGGQTTLSPPLSPLLILHNRGQTTFIGGQSTLSPPLCPPLSPPLSPLLILDFGCGPGRDLKTFRELGHTAIGLEGAPSFAAMAREYSGCEVWQQDFLALDLPPARFDGIFANASLFHVPTAELARVLRELHDTLKPGGVLFSSNPRGNNEEGWNRGRYGVYHDLERWRAYLVAAGFAELAHYYRPPGLPLEQQPWLASAWRKQPMERALAHPR